MRATTTDPSQPASASTRRPKPGRWAPSRLRRFARQPAIYWALALLLATIAAAAVASATRGSAGDNVAVMVATSTIEAGSMLSDRVAVALVPAHLVPATAKAAVDGTEIASRRIEARAIVLDHDVAEPNGLVPGEAALAFPRGPTTPPLAVGAAVLIVIHDDPFAPALQPTVPARVTDVGDDYVVIALATEHLGVVGAAIASSQASLAATG